MGKMDVPTDFWHRCRKDAAWCAKLAVDVFSNMTEPELIKLNCGKHIDFKCDPHRKEHFKRSCEFMVRPQGDTQKIRECIKADIVISSLTGCLVNRKDISFAKSLVKGKGGKGGGKRAANLSGDASSSVAIWASVGVVFFLLICALIAWWYVKGDGRQAKGANKSGKAKMTTGKSKLGSRKSLGSKAGSRAGSQRSKVSQASKGSAKKSRRSGKKK